MFQVGNEYETEFGLLSRHNGPFYYKVRVDFINWKLVMQICEEEHVLAQGKEQVEGILCERQSVTFTDSERGLNLKLGFHDGPVCKYWLKIDRYMFDQLRYMKLDEWQKPPIL